MFLATLYFALPLLGKSRLPLGFLPAESLHGVLAAQGAVGVGSRSFGLGKGVMNPKHLSLGRRCRRALARSFRAWFLFSVVFNDQAWPK